MSGVDGGERRLDYGRASIGEGERVGRFLVLRDLDGVMVAVAASAVNAVCQTDEGVVVTLSGGRAVHVGQSMEMVLAWLDGRMQ